jgi:hypothetical protein
MLSAKEQKLIIQTNRAAFEALALRWRNPRTGDTERDLYKAVLNMICDYCSVPGCNTSWVRSTISELLAEANAGDSRQRVSLDLTSEDKDIPRAKQREEHKQYNLPPCFYRFASLCGISSVDKCLD